MSGDSKSEKRWGDTTSKRGEGSRVFVGNTVPSKVKCSDLDNLFAPHGKITGIDIHGNGFAFIQFSSPDEAQRACKAENGVMLYGKKLEVRMFDKKGTKKTQNSGNRERSRSPVGKRPQSHMNGPSSSSSRRDFHPSPFEQQPGPGAGPPPPVQANDIEIIVMNKDQWGYGEMIEKKLRHETGIQYIDLLFLHSPQHIHMTLNDLFERNIPLDDALGVISRDYRAFSGRNGGGDKHGPPPPVGGIADGTVNGPGLSAFNDNTFNIGRPSSRDGNYPNNGVLRGASGLPPAPVPAPFSQFNTNSIGNNNNNVEKHLPEDISYVLRTTLTEGGCQFLSLSQIDSVIDYFTKERDRLTSQARAAVALPPPSLPFQHHQQQQPLSSYDSYQTLPQTASSHMQQAQSVVHQQPPTSAANLLDNPQIKAALSSLLQIGAIGGTGGVGPASNGSAVGLPHMKQENSMLGIPNDAVSYSTSYASVGNQYSAGGSNPSAGRHHRGDVGPSGSSNNRGPQSGSSSRYSNNRY